MAQEILDTPTRRVSIKDITGSDFQSLQAQPTSRSTEENVPQRRISIKDVEGSLGDPASSLIFPGDTNKYDKILGEGKFHPELGSVYNQQLLHENQTVGKMFGNFLGQVGAEIVGGTLEGIGYMTDLSAGARLANDTQADFGNAVSEFGAEIKEKSRELMPIYVDPYKEGKFDPGSFSWWMSNGVSIASTLSLAIPSLGATKAVMMLGDIANLTRGLSATARVATQGVTQALFSREAESMMEASGIYKDNYQKALDKGMTETEAKEIASLAASNTYNKQWAMLVQDIPQYILLNKLGALKKGGKTAQSISSKELSSPMTDWLGKNRLSTTAGKVGAVAMDMSLEGGEEIYQFLVNEQSNLLAAHLANPEQNAEHSLFEVLKDNYDDGEMWTSGFFGAIGAGVMQAGMAGVNHKVMQAYVKDQMDTVTKFGIGLNQSIKEYSAALKDEDPIKAEQALPSLIFNSTLRGYLNGTLKYQKQMLEELSKGSNPELFTKWGIDAESQGRLKEEPEFLKQVLSGQDRVVELYERFKKESLDNKEIKKENKESSAQVMANTQFLLEETEKMIPKITTRRDTAWSNIEKVETLSEPAQRLVGLEAQKRASQKLLDHFEKQMKERGDKMGKEEKKELEVSIEETGFEIDQIDTAIKDKQKELKKLHKDDPDQAEIDKNTVLPADQVDLFRREEARLEASNKSLKQLTERMKKLRAGKSVVDIKKDEIKDALGIKEEQDTDKIQPEDKVTFLGEDGKPVTGIVLGIEETEDVPTTTYIVQPIDEKTGKEIGEPVAKSGLQLRIYEKNNDELEEEIAPDALSEVEERLIDGETEEEASRHKQTPMAPISKLSYITYDKGEYTSLNSDFSKHVNDPKTSFTGSKAYFLLDRTTEKGIATLKEYVEKYATAKQKPIINKFIAGGKLKEEEIDILLEHITGDKFTDLVDVLPVSVRVTIDNKTFEEGLSLHISNFKHIAIPKNIRRANQTAQKEYRTKRYEDTRNNRITILKKLFSGEEVYSIGLNRSRGVPNVLPKNLPAKERNRNLSKVFGKDAGKMRLAITVSDNTKPELASLRDSKDNIIAGTEKAMNNAGNVYAMVSGETIDGSTVPLKLNRPFIKKEHAEIIFDAFVMVGRAKVAPLGNRKKAVHSYTVNFPEGDDRVKGISAGKVIDLLVNNGKAMTEPNEGRFKKRNIKPGQSELMANKRLYLAISGKRIVLVYGNDKNNNPYTIDLNSSGDIHGKKQHFIEWMSTNKRYAIYLGSKKLKQSLNGDFLNKITFSIGTGENKISRKGTDSYNKFVIDNQLVETDATRDENGNLFVNPVISLNITDKFGKVTDKTIKSKISKFIPVKRGKTITEKPPVQDTPEKPIVKPVPSTQTKAEKEKSNKTQKQTKLEAERITQDYLDEALKRFTGVGDSLYFTSNNENDSFEVVIKSIHPTSKEVEVLHEESGESFYLVKGDFVSWKGTRQEPLYTNPFSNKKDRVVYKDGVERNVKTGPVDLSNAIETAIQEGKTLDETLIIIKNKLLEERIKIGSKGSTANKGVYTYIKDRFAGKTKHTLLEEWNNGKNSESKNSSTVETPSINQEEIPEEADVKAEETPPIIEGGEQESEPEAIPKVKSLKDIMGNFNNTKKWTPDEEPPFAKVATDGPYKAHTKESLEKEMGWAFDVIGIGKEEWDVKTRLADLFYNGRNNFALYSQSAILIYEAAEVGTIYHEGFHRVSLGYFTKKEREQMYRAARQIYKLSTDTYSDKQVEEFLADKFENFVLSNGNKQTPNAIHKFFKPLFDFIKKIFFGRRRLNENEIDQIFNDINNGKFKGRKVLEENRGLFKPGEYAKTMIGGTTFNNLNTREDVKDLIKGLVEKLFDVNSVHDINDVSNLKHEPLISAIEQLLEELNIVANHPEAPIEDKQGAKHLYDLYSEVLGTKQPETGMYDTYSLLIRPQIDSFLLSMGIRETGIEDSNDEHLIDEEDDDGTTKSKKVGKVGGNYFAASYERNKKETALANIKFMIATLHESSHIDENGVRVFDSNEMTHMGRFVDFNKAWSRILNALYYISDINDMIDELRALGEEQSYSPFMELADRLENESEMVRNQFRRTIFSSKHDFINFSAYNSHNYGVKFKINRSSFNEAFFSEVAVWNELFFNDDKITREDTVTIKGQKGYVYRSFFRKEFFNAIEEDYSDLSNNLLIAKEEVDNIKASERESFIIIETQKAIEQIIFLLNRFNIDIDEETIRHIISKINSEDIKNDLDRVYVYLDTRLSTIFSSMPASNAAAEEKQIDRKNMGFFKNREIIALAKAYIEAHPEKMDDMQMGPEKNKYNSFSENSHATEVQNRINNEEGYVEGKAAMIYNKHGRFYNDMLPKSQDTEEINRATKTRKDFALRTFSYLQEQNTGDSGRGFMDITELEDYLIKYSAMFNKDENGNEQSMLPLPSLPRKTYFFMSGVRKFDRVMEDFKRGKIVFTKEVMDYFYGAYLDELERIKEAEAWRYAYSIASKAEKEYLKNFLIKNYHYGKDFNFSLGNAYDLIHFKGFSKNQMDKASFNKKLTEILNKRVTEELEYAQSITVISKDTDGQYSPGMLDRTHTEEYSTKFDENEDIGTRGAIADFTLNYMLATVESEKMFLADPAFFAKNANTGEVFEDVYKRWFGVGSSGENFAETTTSDPVNFYNTMVLNTQKFKAPFYEAMLETHTRLWKEYFTENNFEKLTDIQIAEKAGKIAKERLSEYEKVDATDGQAWISPTMYKNMLERSGMWTDEIQAAFDILNTDKDLSAEEEIKLLQVVLNPQKTAYFGNQEHQGLDLLIYDKMSMTVLFRRLVKGTDIEDLFDRMELEGRYKNVDNLEKIHVINFDSAIKVGGRRGYNLYVDGNKREETNDFFEVNTMKQYWKNLRNQQATNPHDTFSDQTVGSAVYKISSSNIRKNEKYGDYETGMDMLNALTRSRVAISNHGKHRIEAALGIKNGKISNANLIILLRKDAVKAKKSDDFLRALKLDPKTDRSYLELDAFPDRRWIYSRLMRLVTSNTIDLVTPGAQLIQSSDYGFKNREYNNELKFNILEDGATKTVQMECKVSIRMFKDLIPNYSKLKHEERVAAIKGLDLPLLGYRTPTQGQNSIVSMKVAEFLRDEAGDVIHLPLAFTALTGSDFDIDKLYIMFHTFERGPNGKLRKVSFDSDMSESAIQTRYNAKIEELYKVYRTDETVITTEVYEALKEVRNDVNLNNTISLLTQDAKARYANYNGQLKQLEELYNNTIDADLKKEYYREINMLTGLIDDLLEQNGIRIKKEVDSHKRPIKEKALLKAGKLVGLAEFKKLSIEEQNTEAANKNRVIDIFHTVIRDSKHYLSTSQPLGGTTNQLRLRAIRNERIENGGEVKVLEAFGSLVPKFQSETKFKFVTSTKGIGTFALHNSNHSLTQMAALKMKTKVKYGVDKNGVIPLDLIVGSDNVYVTDWISAMIDAHVDAVKDNYITKLNVNDATYGVTALMLRLGFGIKTFDFLSQPILKEYAKEYFRLGGRIKEDVEEGYVDDGRRASLAFKNVFTRYLRKLSIEEDEEVNLVEAGLYIPFDKIINDPKDKSKPSEFLKTDLDPKLKNNADRNKRQLNVLLHFKRILEDAGELNKLVLETRVDTKKIGATPSEQRFSMNKLMELEERGKFPGLKRMINSRGVLEENGTMLAPLLSNSLLYLQGVLKNNTVYGAKGFDDLFWNMAFSIPGSANMRLSSVNNIVEEMFSYFVGEFFGNPEHGIGVNKKYLENLLLHGPTSVFGRLSKIRKKNHKLYKELSNNKMLNSVRVDSKPGIPLETYLRMPPSFSANKWDNDDKIEGFADLFNHPDAEVKSLARAMYLYAYYSTGFRHRFRGYVKHIPSEIHKKLEMYNVSKKKFNEVSFNDFIYNLINELNDGTNSYVPKYLLSMKRSIFENNWFNKWLVPNVDNPDIIKNKYNDASGTVRLVELEVDENSKYALGTNANGDTIYAHFITMKNAAEYNQPTARVTVEEDFLSGEDTSVEEFRGSEISLLELIGINEETGFPIYKPVNKKGFYEMGNILREHGVRDKESVLAMNNLVKQFTDEQTILFAQKELPEFKSIPFDQQQISERAVVQKEEYATNVAQDMMEEDRIAREAIRNRILYDQIKVEKVISGLQTGMDEEGLLVATELGYETGGRTTIDYSQEGGANNLDVARELGVAGMSLEEQQAWEAEIISKETPEIASNMLKNKRLHARTYWNVKNSDATVYFSNSIENTDKDKVGKGFWATRKAASSKYYKKPFFIYVSKEAMDNGFRDRYEGSGIIFSNAEELKYLLKKYQVRVLNVAGSRYSSFKENGNLDKLEHFKDVLKQALTKESPKKEQKREEQISQNKSNPESLSSYERPINLYVDGSVRGNEEKDYGYGVYANIGGKELGLSGTKEEVDKDLAELGLSYVLEQEQFNGSVELLALINALKQFENTAEHLIIRQDAVGSVSYVGLEERATGDPYKGKWVKLQPHTKKLAEEATKLIEKIEKNGGSVRIFYVPSHSNKIKIQNYISKYADKKGITITQAHIDIVTERNEKADKLANHTKKINTFPKFLNQIGTAKPTGLKAGFDKSEKEDQQGREEMLNCRK